MKPRWSLPAFAISTVLLLLAGCTVADGGGAPVMAGDSIPAADPIMPAKVLLSGQAVLVRGSESVRGIPGFRRNAIPALYGEYALLADGGGTQLVSVWFTRESLVLDETWEPLTCPGLPPGFLLSRSGGAGEGPPILVASTAAYRLVIRLPAGFDNPCRFTSVLIERFMFFIRNASREEDISLPAFLQL